MTNTVNDIQIINPPTEVIVQTIGRAALKTFGQTFIGAIAVSAIPLLTQWQADLSGGGSVDMGDVNALGRIVFAAVIAGIAALISFAVNYFGEKTLPSGKTVEAEVKP